VDKASADAAVTNLSVGGAKAVVNMVARGPDIARGWGQGRSVAADYLLDQPALLGSQRLGPDLANVGLRMSSPAWHLLHLYDPRAVVPGSVMPPYRFLFEARKIGQQPSPDALTLSGPTPKFDAAGTRTNWTSPESIRLTAAAAPPSGTEIVPTDEAKALVAYLLSLRADVPLFERPLTAALPKPDVAATNPPATSPLTNAPAK
jgi:cytochrome c oxidase cbb3-type subunit 2